MAANIEASRLYVSVGKIFSKIFQRRLESLLDKYLPEEQTGFWKQKSTTDMIFSLRQFTEKAREQNVNLVKTVFDSVNRG